jgi:hypothetical protein
MALEEMMWHNDGHKLILKLVKSEIEIESVYCPHGNEGECFIQDYGCAVRWFADRFGMECNVGSCYVDKSLEICWTLVGSPRDIESCQVWFMPLADEVFSAWLISLGVQVSQSDSYDQLS